MLLQLEALSLTNEQPPDLALLKRFAPLSEMKVSNLYALAKKAHIAHFGSGRLLFKKGDTDQRSFFLIEGAVELHEKNKLVSTVRAGSPQARVALVPILPRKFTARAANEVRCLTIESDLLDALLTWDQTGRYEVTELNRDGQDGEGDWMMTLLQSGVFQRISPVNIQSIFMRMQPINYRAGDLIIKQGAAGDYFYVVVAGTCLVTRETTLKPIKLAELGCGSSFGEEALIAQASRNATVTMLTDGSLMRLSKKDFQVFLTDPLLQQIDYVKAKEFILHGARWLDVRTPGEYQDFRIDAALNIPTYLLRLKLSVLDKKLSYIVCCDTGRRSSAAAYLLSERGFETYVLKDGLAAADGACTLRLHPAA